MLSICKKKNVSYGDFFMFEYKLNVTKCAGDLLTRPTHDGLKLIEN